MKQAMLMLTALLMVPGLLASAACDDGWENQVTIEARARTTDGEVFPTQVEVDVHQSMSLGHGDTDSRSVPAQVAIGGSATDLELTSNGAGTYVPAPGAIDELHVQIDGVHLSQPMPRLVAELTTTSPGAVATVIVTSGDGDEVRVGIEGQSGLECGSTSDGIQFEILPGCVPSPGRYRLRVISSRVVQEPDVDLEATFGGTAFLYWDLTRSEYLDVDLP